MCLQRAKLIEKDIIQTINYVKIKVNPVIEKYKEVIYKLITDKLAWEIFKKTLSNKINGDTQVLQNLRALRFPLVKYRRNNKTSNRL